MKDIFAARTVPKQFMQDWNAFNVTCNSGLRSETAALKDYNRVWDGKAQGKWSNYEDYDENRNSFLETLIGAKRASFRRANKFSSKTCGHLLPVSCIRSGRGHGRHRQDLLQALPE
jgi:hypothetical protein